MQKRTFSNTEGLHDAKLILNISAEDASNGTTGEYTVETPFNSEFVPKIQHWIEKRKFKCTQISDDEVSIRIGNLFDFTAQKKSQNDMQGI